MEPPLGSRDPEAGEAVWQEGRTVRRVGSGPAVRGLKGHGREI